ncbi:phosphatase IMPL1, chloroplastic-like isoform X2 [Camellia sinensis]|uniref:phosphatase IMPL1, chloroplastic-like isoform X2 n=1 Tax=Camellia sinensis TaxID=4442 RepID=UPI001035A25A|nr:phosphatase IMPL1, chloroplastic-like isoform X2 [Camellia sinensis]
MKKLATGINNNYLRLKGALFLIIALAFAINDGDAQNSTTLIPSILTFGDSAVDVGNNDHIHTIFKANFPPYGRDFINHKPTGRFCNGKLATDITDRTTNFAHCYPGFAVSMGVLYKEKPAIGAVVEQSLLVTGFGYEHDDAWSTNIELFKEFTDASRGVRRLGAAAVDMCHVALGIVEAYWEYHLKPWDMAAGVLHSISWSNMAAKAG